MAVQVALRKESVDRNSAVVASVGRVVPSLSARRAWIEISCTSRERATLKVALRKESVDRNAVRPMLGSNLVRRSPQGERG